MVRVEKSYDRLNKKWVYDVKHGRKFLTRARDQKDAVHIVRQFKTKFKKDAKYKAMWLS